MNNLINNLLLGLMFLGSFSLLVMGLDGLTARPVAERVVIIEKDSISEIENTYRMHVQTVDKDTYKFDAAIQKDASFEVGDTVVYKYRKTKVFGFRFESLADKLTKL